jgi:hypothetical protein
MKKYIIAFVLFCTYYSNNVCWAAGVDCGWLATTEWKGPYLLVSGKKYENLSEHEENCATEGKKGKCYCRVTLTQQQTYSFIGEAQAGWFGLQAGWESQTTASAEDIKDLETTTPGECVGPMWGYKIRDFGQKYTYRRKIGGGIPNYCLPCSDNVKISTLLKGPRVTCSSTQHSDEYDPSLKDTSDVCATL